MVCHNNVHGISSALDVEMQQSYTKSSIWHSLKVGSRHNGPLASYAKLWVAHAPGIPGTFSPAPWVSDPDMHHGTCVTHVPWCMPGSLCSGFLWSRWWGKRSRHSRPMRNPQFYVSGKRPMPTMSSLQQIVKLIAIGWRYILNVSLKNAYWHINTRGHSVSRPVLYW